MEAKLLSEEAKELFMSPAHYPIDSSWKILTQDLGVNTDVVLRQAQLCPELFDQPNAQLKPDDFYKFWDVIASYCGGELFAIRFMEALTMESFSPPIFAAIRSANLLTALQRIACYKSLVAPIHVQIKQSSVDISVEFSWLNAEAPPPISLVFADLLFAVKLARLGTRRLIVPTYVSSPRLPATIDEFAESFGCIPQIGSAHKICFSLDDALYPFVTIDEAMWAVIEPELQRRLVKLKSSDTVQQRTKAVLLQRLSDGAVSMDDVAKTLAMSKRTLHRKLEFEGFSFKQILDTTRKEMSLHYIKNTSMSAAEISFLVGFEEITSFYRAFNRWTSTTPENMRRATKNI